MSLPPLAVRDDVIAVAQRDLTEPEHASVYQLLDAASDQFRAASQQQFTPASRRCG
ncbi:hypothetical protein [Gordonia westfalica]|uniref:hypothetical protein n=1 Tax=Gordonia westfalica TaxID=158898 RepID=UPI0013563266|nr:hypothetical protein [Gordonia westfalica]